MKGDKSGRQKIINKDVEQEFLQLWNNLSQSIEDDDYKSLGRQISEEKRECVRIKLIVCLKRYVKEIGEPENDLIVMVLNTVGKEKWPVKPKAKRLQSEVERTNKLIEFWRCKEPISRIEISLGARKPYTFEGDSLRLFQDAMNFYKDMPFFKMKMGLLHLSMFTSDTTIYNLIIRSIHFKVCKLKFKAEQNSDLKKILTYDLLRLAGALPETSNKNKIERIKNHITTEIR